MTKIKEEKLTLTYNLKEKKQRFEEEKAKAIEILNKATPETIVRLDDYTAFSTMKRYAYEIEIMEAKLRVVDYLWDESSEGKGV